MLPFDHVPVRVIYNNYKPTTRDAVSNYVETIAAVDCHALPVHVRGAEKQYVYPCFDTENFIVFPRKHSFRSFLYGYSAQTETDDKTILFSTFRDKIKHALPHIRVSLRSRIICDTCFVYRESIRTKSAQKLPSKAE